MILLKLATLLAYEFLLNLLSLQVFIKLITFIEIIIFIELIMFIELIIFIVLTYAFMKISQCIYSIISHVSFIIKKLNKTLQTYLIKYRSYVIYSVFFSYYV